MVRHRFEITRSDKVYAALVAAVDVAREGPVDFDVGPWDDEELRQRRVIEVSGPDEAAELVVNRWIDQSIGFEAL